MTAHRICEICLFDWSRTEPRPCITHKVPEFTEACREETSMRYYTIEVKLCVSGVAAFSLHPFFQIRHCSHCLPVVVGLGHSLIGTLGAITSVVP